MRGQKKNEKTKIAAVLVMAVILILGGTYAWSDYSQHKSNEFSTGAKYLYDVTLIDDFVEVKDWQQGQTVPSNIKVKNMSTATGSAYVRLALKEYLEFGDLEEEFSNERYMIDTSGEFLKSDEGTKSAALVEIKSTWGDARYQGITEEDLVQDSGYTDDDDDYWYVKTKGGDPNGQYGKFLLRTSEYATESLVAGVERSYDAYGEVGHQKYPNGECKYTTRIWPADITDLNTTDAHGFTDYISWKLGDNVEVISSWDGFTGKTAKWYLDAATGYAYWGEALEPNDETSSLLESVTLKYRPEADYFYYDVHADMVAISEDEDFDQEETSELPNIIEVTRDEYYVGEQTLYRYTVIGTGVPGAEVTINVEGFEGSGIVAGDSRWSIEFTQQDYMLEENDVIRYYQKEDGKKQSATKEYIVPSWD